MKNMDNKKGKKQMAVGKNQKKQKEKSNWQ